MKPFAIAVAALSIVIAALPAGAVEPEPGPVWDTWARTDLPVAEGLAQRTWMWGPEATTPPMVESYADAPDGQRAVQYFEKSRMEITDPAGDSASPWYVTNGLLVVELITGQLQLGDAEFEAREPAEVNVAGDADDPDGIRYSLLAGLLDAPHQGTGAI